MCTQNKGAESRNCTQITCFSDTRLDYLGQLGKSIILTQLRGLDSNQEYPAPKAGVLPLNDPANIRFRFLRLQRIAKGSSVRTRLCDILYRIIDLSGRRELDPLPSPWQGDVLPMNYARNDNNFIKKREKTQSAAFRVIRISELQ